MNLDRSYRDAQKLALDGRIAQTERLMKWVLIVGDVGIGGFVLLMVALKVFH